MLVLASVASMVGTPSSKLVDVPTTFASTLLVTAVGSVGSTLGMPSSKLVLRLTASTTFTSVVVAALSSVFLTPIASAMPATPVTAVSVIPVSEAMVALGVLMLASVAVSA